MSGKDFTNHHNRDPQEFRTAGEVTYIQLYDRIGQKTAEAIIDTESIDVVKGYKWYSSRKYVISAPGTNKRSVRLHRLVLGVHDSSYPFVDHINGNPLDNRAANLRLVDYRQSVNNTKPRDLYKGTFFDKWCSPNTKNKWRVKISFEGTVFEVGRFATQEEAAWMYDQYASQIFGDYAKLNFDYS